MKHYLHNSNKAVAASLLTIVMSFGLTACSDTTDNPVIPSTDSEITVYTDNIDKTVRPGDDFYMYCIGSWWQRTEIPIGSNQQMFLFGEAKDLFDEKIQVIAAIDPNFNTLAAHCEDLFANSEADQQKLNEALTNKLKADGLSDEAVRQQQRNFFVAYANLWRLKYTDEFAESMVTEDDHSQSKERINGIVTNIDAWYDLFDVKQGDRLYIAPENRIRIW